MTQCVSDMSRSVSVCHGVSQCVSVSVSRCVVCRQKEGDLARVVLNASESAVLPVVRSPLVKSPLRMADWFTGNGAALLQKAVPRLTDTKQVSHPPVGTGHW